MSKDTSVKHYGIKGMRWGVRRSNEQLARARSSKSEDASVAEDALKKAKTQGVSSLSNKELNALNTRLNLEANYARLNEKSSPEAGMVKKGAKWAGKNVVQDVLVNAAKEIGKEYVKGEIKSRSSRKDDND